MKRWNRYRAADTVRAISFICLLFGIWKNNIEEETEYLCPVCEHQISPEDKVCPYCGAVFSEVEETEEIEDVIMKALEKRKEDRWQSAEEFKKALGGLNV